MFPAEGERLLAAIVSACSSGRQEVSAYPSPFPARWSSNTNPGENPGVHPAPHPGACLYDIWVCYRFPVSALSCLFVFFHPGCFIYHYFFNCEGLGTFRNNNRNKGPRSEGNRMLMVTRAAADADRGAKVPV